MKTMLSAVCTVSALMLASLYATAEIALGLPFYSGGVLPAPREADYRDEFAVLVNGAQSERNFDLRAVYEGPSATLAARLLDDRLATPIRDLPSAPSTFPFIIGLINDEPVRAALETLGMGEGPRTLPPQGYLLEIRPDIIICAGADNAGVANAMASFLQLLDVRDGGLVARCATIRDWPAFQIRYTAEYHLPGREFFDWMMLYKINGFAACYPGMRWEGLSEDKVRGLEVIGDYIEQFETMHFMAQFHVGGRAGRPVDCGNPDDVARLLETIHQTIELAHAQHIMICYDDVHPELQPREKEQFEAPAQAHGRLMEQVYAAVKAQSPDTVVSFCTPYYQGRGHRRWRNKEARAEGLAYLAGVGEWPNKDIRIVWTGPVTESRRITPGDIASYREWINRDGPLVYWDNTWHYHQPLRNFHAKYPEDFVKYCADSTSYINVNGVRPIGRFFAATANDYYWDPEAFDSKRSRRQAVAQFMGPGAVPAAERLYDVRGDDYFVFFARDVDLDAFDQAVAELEAASLDPAIPKQCRDVYESVAQERKQAEEDKRTAERLKGLSTAPLMHGTLWWITDAYAEWTREQFAEAIDAQRAIGFDVLWILNTPALLAGANESRDVMEMVYSIADEKGMRVIADLPRGGWYGQTSGEEMAAALADHAERYHKRYGHHASFYGWYLNHEINPLKPGEETESAYWRGVWKAAVDACHKLAPQSAVTISPFFLLDEPSRRGFVYLTPQQYADWWGTTLEETGIDILMLQDSGEHLSFFTLEQREPFFKAVAEACHKAGAQFWVNVETGEGHVKDWDEYLRLSQEKAVPWRFTPIDWLEKKLFLAAKYGDSIINWGYFPYMDPMPVGGAEIEGREEAYAAYKAYYERVKRAQQLR